MTREEFTKRFLALTQQDHEERSEKFMNAMRYLEFLYEEALLRIANLDPEKDSEDGFNEWGESDCFRQAQAIAEAVIIRRELAPRTKKEELK